MTGSIIVGACWQHAAEFGNWKPLAGYHDCVPFVPVDRLAAAITCAARMLSNCGLSFGLIVDMRKRSKPFSMAHFVALSIALAFVVIICSCQSSSPISTAQRMVSALEFMMAHFQIHWTFGEGSGYKPPAWQAESGLSANHA